MYKRQDGWCAVIAAVYGKVGFIDKGLILYRQHEENVCGIKKVSKIDKIQTIIRTTFNGTQCEQKKKWISEIQKMSIELDSFHDLPCDKKEVIHKIAYINKKNKLFRVLFFIRYRILRGHGNLWMLLWV